MGDVANRDDALRCLELAKAALAAKNYDRALKLAEKGNRLFSSTEALNLVTAINRAKGAAGASASTTTESASHREAPAGIRQRSTAKQSDAAEDESARATPEQREQVAKIVRTKCYYEVLGISKEAGDDDIKRAYRKLALKLHPDKNKAKGADDAFKAVSRAFTTLSDPEKRKHYDMYGVDEPQQLRRGGGGAAAAAAGYDEFDPDLIFQMFFNGGFHPGARTQFRQWSSQHGVRRAQAAQSSTPPLAHFLSLLPIALLLLMTLFSGQSEPSYSLDRDVKFRDEMVTGRFSIPFYVKNVREFEREYPRNSHKRARAEQQVEVDYKDRVEKMCYQEKLQQQRLQRWGYADKAAALELKSCDELYKRFGQRHTNYYY